MDRLLGKKKKAEPPTPLSPPRRADAAAARKSPPRQRDAASSKDEALWRGWAAAVKALERERFTYAEATLVRAAASPPRPSRPLLRAPRSGDARRVVVGHLPLREGPRRDAPRPRVRRVARVRLSAAAAGRAARAAPPARRADARACLRRRPARRGVGAVPAGAAPRAGSRPRPRRVHDVSGTCPIGAAASAGHDRVGRRAGRVVAGVDRARGGVEGVDSLPLVARRDGRLGRAPLRRGCARRARVAGWV